MLTFTGLVMIVFGVLQIILFFKLWGMTNDVSKIKDLLETKLVNMQTTKGQSVIIENETDIQSSKKVEKIEFLNDINIGDKVFRLSDKREMIVDSIDDGQYFCKGSFIEGYAYYKRDEIELPIN